MKKKLKKFKGKIRNEEKHKNETRNYKFIFCNYKRKIIMDIHFNTTFLYILFQNVNYYYVFSFLNIIYD